MGKTGYFLKSGFQITFECTQEYGFFFSSSIFFFKKLARFYGRLSKILNNTQQQIRKYMYFQSRLYNLDVFTL